MKIFLAFFQSLADHRIPAYQFWEHYLKNGILENGDTFTETSGADWALGLVPQSKESLAGWKARIWEDTVRSLKAQPADIFLSYLYPQQIDEAAIREIQAMGIPCVNFFCDHVREFSRVPAAFSVFDLSWVPEFKAIAMYRRAGLPFIHLPMPMWVSPGARKITSVEKQVVVFAGSGDIQRKLLLNELVALSPGLPLEVYGSGWLLSDGTPASAEGRATGMKLANQLAFIRKHGWKAYLRKLQQRGISMQPSPGLIQHLKTRPGFKSYTALLQESAVTLGINRYPDFRYPFHAPNTYSRLRDIEAPMLGACYLTEWTEGIEQLYDTANEIAVYRSAAELSQQCDRLLGSASLRKKMRAGAQQRALSDHSLPASLEKIKQRLFKSGRSA